MPAGHTPDDLWNYSLPQERIARHPCETRDASRLLHLPFDESRLYDRTFLDLELLLEPGDLLVGNNTRVMACRLQATRATGGAVELLVLEPGPGNVRALARPAKKLQPGDLLTLPSGHRVTVTAPAFEGIVEVSFDAPIPDVMAANGEMPLPPYLKRAATPSDATRYQTVYAGPLGAAAAPTAGLHFTRGLLSRLEARGIGWAEITLHVGLGTFRPLKPADIEKGELHAERYDVPEKTCEAIQATRAQGGRVVAIGTTTVRALEAATPQGAPSPLPGPGETSLFLKPPAPIRTIDGMVTNLHLPNSSLLMLVACLVGRERLLNSYKHAVSNGYRFYSYGDAMLLL